MEFFNTIVDYIPKFLPAVWMTLSLSFLSIVLGTITGMVFAFMKLSRLVALNIISKVYLAIVRGTPLLLQLIFIYSALPLIGLKFSPFVSAAIGLAFHNGAYITEIFRGSIQSIDIGQSEAARSLGMTKFQAMRRVILPQAVKRAIPPLGNQFIIAVKDSSLASAVTIAEIMMVSRRFASANFRIFEAFTVAAIYYMIITYLLSMGVSWIETRLRVSERRKGGIAFD